MKIAIASDHAGYAVKEEIKKQLDESGIEYTDLGPEDDNSVDYPDFALKVAEQVVNNRCRGILVCGTGIGMSIAANKVRGVRAALCYDGDTAEMARKHNDANILTVGARTTELKTIKRIVDVFLKTDFEGGRHQKRLDIISSIEKRYMK